jgi:serine/threonine protein kinase
MSSTSKRDSDLGNRPSMSGAAALEAVAPAALGKYSPFARLGHGGMADVFLAVARGPVGFNKLAVVKRLHRSEDLQMFLDEARLSARLSHPNIVNTYEVGEASGQYFIAMEYLEGQPLQAILTDWSARGVKIEETVAAFAAMQALRGLHYAHELADYDGTPLHVVHRDVSPQNLFITYQGEVKLLDFGIAKAALNSTQT